jgi:steroid delta-isomerase-like uncharacterized protein
MMVEPELTIPPIAWRIPSSIRLVCARLLRAPHHR